MPFAQHPVTPEEYYDQDIPYTSTSQAAEDLVNRFFDKVAKRRGRHRVLDVGCGRGDDANVAESFGLEVVGLDLSDGELAKFRRCLPDAVALKADARYLNQNEELSKWAPFDAVFCSFVLIHLSEQEGHAVLDQLRAALVPGGDIFVATNTLRIGQGWHTWAYRGDPTLAPTGFWRWNTESLTVEFKKRFDEIESETRAGTGKEVQLYLTGRRPKV